MSEIITSTVEKDDGHGFLKTDAIRLTEIGGGIAHTITCREGALCVQHCNLIIEVEKLSEVINPCKGLSEYGWHFEQNVYDSEGIVRSIKSGEGSGNIPKTIEVEKVEIKELGNYMPSEYNASKVVDTNGLAPTVMENHGTVTGVVEIQELGGLEEGSSQRRKVFDENGVSPTLQAAMGSGGGNVPMVVDKTELKELGYLEKGTGKHQSNIIYDKEGLSPCICAGIGVKQQPTMTIEQTCVAMRGRNPENPSDRKPGIELEQRLEPNTTGCTNTITTVQKDNLVLEEQVVAYDEQNQTVRSDTFGTLTTDGSSPKHNNRVIKIRQATKQGFIECEVGGGMRFELPDKRIKTGKNNRERSDKSNPDNGEYP